MNLKVKAKLDPQFAPMSVFWREFEQEVAGRPSQPLGIAVERNQGLLESLTLDILRDGEDDKRNAALVERLAKSMLWAYGGFRLHIAGSRAMYECIRAAYAPGGTREFDRELMSRVFEQPFEVCYAENVADLPALRRSASPAGRHLDGCRIGFDAGGSDRKVSAVIDGQAVFSEEVVWHPKINTDPDYHYQGILSAMRQAAAHMPRVDAIGISSAGIYVDNKIMAASLFLKVSKEDFARRVKTMYLDVCREIGQDIPVEVANDGDVTALAGAMDLEDTNVLGIAMGTSEAGGYVDGQGNITGWLNELAFVPVDANEQAMIDEWSGDYGCGVKYFSQDAVIKLAPAAGIELDAALSPAEKLKVVQGLMEQKDRRALDIYDTIGAYFGYAIAYYARLYDIKHVLVMGRVTSGEGGVLLLARAQEVLNTEFPELAARIRLTIPDETSRRVGQSIAAASLPALKK
ncbi:MAG: ROK family protein [Clostridia bacterium]|nr:ROK family protein [Clostridia bacterium]